MDKMKKFCEIIETELGKIAEKGLTTSNLDAAYKLVDMYKDLKNTDYWETKGEYYDTVLIEMQGGYSHNDERMMDDGYSMRGRKRDSMGRYSRDDGYSMNDGYSRDTKEELRMMMDRAKDEREREALRKAYDSMTR